MRKLLKQRLAAGESVFGSFAFMPSPDVVEIMGLAGFDFVLIDLEHSPKDWDAVTNMVRAAELHGMAPLIRVQENSEKTILQVLELGIQGIVLPFVQTAEDVRRAVKAMNYAPKGARGTCTLTRAARYGGLRSAFVEHTQNVNEQLVLVAQVEDAKGVENIEEICAVAPGVDVMMIGRSDLASSLGRPGQVEDPVVLDATRKVIEVARRRNIPSAIGLYTPEEAPKWIDSGCRFFFYSSDTAIMLNATSAAWRAFKAAMSSQPSRTAAE